MTRTLRRTRCRTAAVLLAAGCVAATAAGCSAAAPASTPASAPHRHAVSGTITAERGTTWTLTQGTGQTATVTLTSSTRYGRRDQPAGPAQFPVGTAVRVLGETHGDALDADRVLPPLAAHPEQPPAASPSTAASSPTTPAPPSGTAPAAGVDPVRQATTAVADAVASATSHPGVSAGVAVMDRSTGQLVAGTTGSAPFESASVVKLFTIVDLLHRSETGTITLSPQDDDDIGRALRLSDDDAMDDLWENHGGTATVTDVVGLAHLQDTTPASDPDEWGETVISARDVTAVYRYATTQLSPADQRTITDGLSQASDTGADGFDQAFGLLRPPRPAGALAKQGWMTDGATFLHTTGVPAAGSRWIVAVLTRAPASTSWDTARSTVDDATRTLTAGLP